jgi:ABC-type Na+ efflux pump permease subunit
MLTATAAGLLTICVLVASSAIARERDDRTLDLLLTTPLEPADYLRGKVLGLLRLFWPPTAAILVVAATASLVLWTMPPDLPDPQTAPLLLPGGLGAFALALPGFLCFGIAIGLSWSVRSRQWTVAAATSITICGIVVLSAMGLAVGVYHDVAGLGPVLLAMSPLTSPAPATDPTGWFDAVEAHWNISMLIGGGVGGLVWLTAAWVVLKTTSHSFTPTVRRLAGLD